jgi:hypothetical protein
VWINVGLFLLLRPSLDKFHNPGLAFRQKGEEKDNEGNGSQERDKGKGKMTMTTTTVAVGGATPNNDKTRTLLQAAVMATARLNILLAPSPQSVGWQHLLQEEGCGLEDIILAAMSTKTTTTMTVQMPTGVVPDEQTPFDY